jgi:hypothetical protein
MMPQEAMASSQVQAVGAGHPAIQLLQWPGVAATCLAVQDKRLEGSHLAAGRAAGTTTTPLDRACRQSHKQRCMLVL